MILEYKPHRGRDKTLSTPDWVENGGHMYNPSNYTYVGFSPSVREYKIPDSVTVLTLAEAKERMQTIHSLHPVQKEEGGDMTSAEVDALVEDIVAQNDIS